MHRLADGAGPAQAQQQLAKTEARASDHANTDCRQLCLNMQRLQQAQLSELKQQGVCMYTKWAEDMRLMYPCMDQDLGQPPINPEDAIWMPD